MMPMLPSPDSVHCTPSHAGTLKFISVILNSQQALLHALISQLQCNRTTWSVSDSAHSFLYFSIFQAWHNIACTLPCNFAFVLPTLIYYKYLPLYLQYTSFKHPSVLSLTLQGDLTCIAHLHYCLYFVHIVFTPLLYLSLEPSSLPLKLPWSIVTKVCVFHVIPRQWCNLHYCITIDYFASLYTIFTQLCVCILCPISLLTKVPQSVDKSAPSLPMFSSGFVVCFCMQSHC